MSVRRHRLKLVVLVTVAAVSASASASSSGSASPSNCRSRQLRLSGHLTAAARSLHGTLTLRNTGGRPCGLPLWPRRLSIVIGSQLLPTLTVHMHRSQWPPGVPTRMLAARRRVTLGVAWRNWCGAPRGVVRASLVLTVFTAVTPHLALGTVTTPPCADAKYSSTVAASRFLRR